LSGNQPATLAFRELKRISRAEEQHAQLENTKAKMNLRVMTQEEKIQEASKPLYLKRYE